MTRKSRFIQPVWNTGNVQSWDRSKYIFNSGLFFFLSVSEMTPIQFREPPEINACIPGSSFKVCLLQIEQHQMAHLSRFHRWHDENQASWRPPRKALTGPFNGDTQPARAVILSDPHLASYNLGAWARWQWAAQMVNKSGRLPARGSWREGLGWMSSWQFSLQRRRANTHTYTCWSPDLFSRAQTSSDFDLWQPAGAQCRLTFSQNLLKVKAWVDVTPPGEGIYMWPERPVWKVQKWSSSQPWDQRQPLIEMTISPPVGITCINSTDRNKNDSFIFVHWYQ